jgi:hypothetical protein
MRPIRRVIVHHSASRVTETAAEVRHDHVVNRGWKDIGYHWFLHRLLAPSSAGGDVPGPWTVEQGRDETVIGAHDDGENSDSIGVCIAGDYSKGPVPADGWAVLVSTVADVCRRYGLTADQVEGHREHETAASATLCPGFDPEELRDSVRVALARA